MALTRQRCTASDVAASVRFLALTILLPAAARAADAAAGAVEPANSSDAASAADSTSGGLATIEVTAKRLNEERSSIETRTGASTYTIDNQAIAAAPMGENQSLSQVLLQAPGVVQDSFGQLHVRGDHNGLQYRLNGVILPEGISVFSQTLSPRLISSVSLITGALPAEYGLRTAGVIDLTSNSGLLQPGGYLSVYGGSFGTIQPAFEYGGSSGSFSYYVTGDYKQSNLGIESPDGTRDPLHNHTTQYHGFGYLEKILDQANRLSLILGISDGAYQIPNQRGLQPTLGLNVQGVTQFLSDNLDENQQERTTSRLRLPLATPACTSHPTGSGICCTTALRRMPSRTTPRSAGRRMPPTSYRTLTPYAPGSSCSTTAPRALPARRSCPSMRPACKRATFR